MVTTAAPRPLATVPVFASIDAKKKVWGVAWESATLGPPPAPGTEIEVTKKDQTTTLVKLGAVHRQYETRFIFTIGDEQQQKSSQADAPKPADAPKAAIVELPNSPF